MIHFLKKVYRYSYSQIASLFEKRLNKKNFDSIYKEMRDMYIQNKNKYDFSDFVVDQWKKNMSDIEGYFLKGLSFSFLNYRVIKETMFLYTFKKWRNIQKSLIKKYLGTKEIRNILQEYNVGKPLLNDIEFITSGNSIHHLYHLVKFFKETGTTISAFNTVVEVGGGYGNLAKIFRKMNTASTYIIIDIPIFSYVQAVYLKTIFGNESVNMVHNNTMDIKKGVINIIPLDKNVQGAVANIISDVDLFISTWALSESNKNMQDYIKDMDYFKAKYLLLAYQKSVESFVNAEDIKNIPRTYANIFNEETEYVKDNFYLFCKRN